MNDHPLLVLAVIVLFWAIVAFGLYIILSTKLDGHVKGDDAALTDDQFHSKLNAAVKQMALNGRSFSDIADSLFISAPTLRRWLAKKNLPHPLIRAAVLSKLDK